MNITKYNYKRSLPLILQSLNSCDYLAIDMEFSGILKHETFYNSSTDSAEHRYWKHRECVSSFLPTQFGLATFHLDESSQTLSVRPFNFYLFPFDLPRQDFTFMSSVGALTFLSRHGFDFNKMIYEGVGFTNQERYMKFWEQESLQRKQAEAIEA